MQSNGKRRICNVERNGWSLNSDRKAYRIRLSLFPMFLYSSVLQYILFLTLPLRYNLLRRDCTRRGISCVLEVSFSFSRIWARWVFEWTRPRPKRTSQASFILWFLFFLVLLAWVQCFAETSFNLRLKKTRASSSSGGGVCGVSAPCFHSKFIRASASFLNVLVNRLETVEPQVLLQRFALHPGW